jgi:hypothetical protein
MLAALDLSVATTMVRFKFYYLPLLSKDEAATETEWSSALLNFAKPGAVVEVTASKDNELTELFKLITNDDK